MAHSKILHEKREIRGNRICHNYQADAGGILHNVKSGKRQLQKHQIPGHHHSEKMQWCISMRNKQCAT